MKKYGMLLFSIVIFLLTASTYNYQNTNLAVTDYREPKINFKSEKLGEVRNIIWSPTLHNHLIVLSDHIKSKDETLSFIHDINLETGEATELYKFPTNANLRDLLVNPYAGGPIYTASSEGINIVNLSYSPEGVFAHEKQIVSIPDFNNVDSLGMVDKIYYTKSTDKLLYVKDLPPQGMNFFFNQSMQPAYRTLYIPIDKFLFTDGDMNLYYTKRTRNGVNAYKGRYRVGLGGIEEELLFKNIVYARNNRYLQEKFIALTDEGDRYGVFYGGLLSLKIEKNTDLLGQIPDLHVTSNDNFKAVYTSFDINHNGSIFILNSLNKPVEILKDQPIAGPIRVSQSSMEQSIVFFTHENNETRVKLCKIDISDIRDITEFFK